MLLLLRTVRRPRSTHGTQLCGRCAAPISRVRSVRLGALHLVCVGSEISSMIAARRGYRVLQTIDTHDVGQQVVHGGNSSGNIITEATDHNKDIGGFVILCSSEARKQDVVVTVSGSSSRTHVSNPTPHMASVIGTLNVVTTFPGNTTKQKLIHHPYPSSFFFVIRNALTGLG